MTPAQYTVLMFHVKISRKTQKWLRVEEIITSNVIAKAWCMFLSTLFFFVPQILLDMNHLFDTFLIKMTIKFNNESYTPTALNAKNVKATYKFILGKITDRIIPAFQLKMYLLFLGNN